ncbi:hypothetical protein HK100_007193 [Physocladia obscura]|uniref:Uncharacterized protein n=1 Tax=Physocladia obscura TaxID=109957 RepID=A0AAD5SPH9_9FUNG|nr:hypothetical protein HK100_007193 [Physocladia obscura]
MADTKTTGTGHTRQKTLEKVQQLRNSVNPSFLFPATNNNNTIPSLHVPETGNTGTISERSMSTLQALQQSNISTPGITIPGLREKQELAMDLHDMLVKTKSAYDIANIAVPLNASLNNSDQKPLSVPSLTVPGIPPPPLPPATVGSKKLSLDAIERTRSQLLKSNKDIAMQEHVRHLCDARNAKLTVATIMLLTNRGRTVLEEKRFEKDLKEKERIGRRIADLEVQESRIVLETHKITGERQEREKEIEILKGRRIMVC